MTSQSSLSSASVVSKKTTTNPDGTRTVVTTTITPAAGGGSVKETVIEDLPSLPSVQRESTTLSDGSVLVKKTTTIVHPGGRREVTNEQKVTPPPPPPSGTVSGSSSVAAPSSTKSAVHSKDRICSDQDGQSGFHQSQPTRIIDGVSERDGAHVVSSTVSADPTYQQPEPGLAHQQQPRPQSQVQKQSPQPTNINKQLQQQQQQTQFQQQPSIFQRLLQTSLVPNNATTEEPLPAPEPEPPKRNKKVLIVASVIAAIILVTVGTTVGVVVSNNNDSNPSSPKSLVSQPVPPALPSPSNPVPPFAGLPPTSSPPSSKPSFSTSADDIINPMGGGPAAPNLCLFEDSIEYCFESNCNNVSDCSSCKTFVRDTNTNEVKGYCQNCGTCESGFIFFDCANIGFRNLDCEDFVTNPPSPFLGSAGPTTARTILQVTSHPTKFPTVRPTNFSTNFPTNFPTVRPTNFPTVRPSNSPTVRPTSDSVSFTLEGEYLCSKSGETVESCVNLQCQDPGCDCDAYFRDLETKETIGTCSACTVCGFDTENFLDLTCNLYGVDVDLDC